MSPSEGLFRHGHNHHDVFISYAQEDKVIADAVCVKLESRHIRCWIAPRDVPVGKNFPEAIMDGIEGCKIMVMIFSSYSNSSPHVLRELTTAVNKGRIIVPFRIEDVLPSKSIEYLISVPHWMDAITPPLEKHIDELATTIRHILTPESAESICTSCKTPLSPNALFCENCGTSVTVSPPPPPVAEPPAAPQPPGPVVPSPPVPEPVPPVAASPPAHPSRNRNLLIGAGIVGIVLVALVFAFTLNFSSLLPAMGIQTNGGANTPVTAAPTQVNYRSEDARVNTVSLTVAPTQALPEGNTLTIIAEKSPLNLEVTVKFEGGRGQGLVQDNQVILTRSDGTVTRGKLDFSRKPSELSLQGTRGTDRLQVIVTLRSGETYTIVDQLLLYRSRG
jgi:hypothetical protein